MKVILSRKGFDSKAGGCPSPILPDGTLLSLPIPSKDGDRYEDLYYNGKSYSEILKELNPDGTYECCHLDPDIRPKVRAKTPKKWKAAFGQSGNVQSMLRNAGVTEGDIFLFFGWFRHVEEIDGKYKYVEKESSDSLVGADLHVIYGYLIVDKVLEQAKEIKEYYWHPHADYGEDRKPNALYIPHLKCEKAYGTLKYREDRVLTMKGQPRSKWNRISVLEPEHIYGKKKRKNSFPEGIYYKGQWQELIVNESNESDDLEKWVKKIIS